MNNESNNTTDSNAENQTAIEAWNDVCRLSAQGLVAKHEEVGAGADLGKDVVHGVAAVDVNGCHEEDREDRLRCREAQHKAEEEGEVLAHQASRLRHDAPYPHPAQIMWCRKILHRHAPLP